MSTNTNTNTRQIDTTHYYQCAIKSCQTPMQANGDGGLDIQATGGYGDFCDDFDSSPTTFRLCHKHSHKFARWINNPDILHQVNGHSHSGSEKGFWYGHVGWETTTWLSYLNLFFTTLIQQGWSKAKSECKHQLETHLRWSKTELNNSDAKVDWIKFVGRIFFTDHSYAGSRFYYRRIKWKYLDWLKKAYRKHNSLYTDLTTKAMREGLSDTEKHVIKAIASAITASEEE